MDSCEVNARVRFADDFWRIVGRRHSTVSNGDLVGLADLHLEIRAPL